MARNRNIFDTALELEHLKHLFADAVKSAIDDMASIPLSVEEFFDELGAQPVRKEDADAIKQCIGRIYKVIDPEINRVDDLPYAECIGIFQFISWAIHHPRVVKAGVNWSLKEIIETFG